MKTNEKWQWIIVYLGPAAIITLLSLGYGPLILILGGVVGVFTGFTSEAPYFTSEFRLLLGTACTLCIVMFVTGIKFKDRFWGKALNSAGVYLWCVSGLFGFGPQ